MSHPPVSQTPSRRGRRRAFTLIELIVVLIIVGALVAIAGVAYNVHVTNARDAVAQANLRAVAEKASIDLMNGDTAVVDAAYLQANVSGLDLQAVAPLAGGETVATVAAGDGWTVLPDDGPSTQAGAVSWKFTGSAGSYVLALATRASTGHCAMALSSGAAQSWIVEKDLDGNCTADLAAQGRAAADAAAPIDADTIGYIATLTAAAGDKKVDLTWSAAAGATSYVVYRNGAEVATVPGTTYTDTGRTPGATYTYEVAATVSGKLRAKSTPASATLPVAAPQAAPSNVTVVGGLKQLTVTWDAPASTPDAPVTGYQVLLDGTPAASGTVSGVGTTSVTLTGLTDGTTYQVSVRATNVTGSGPASAAKPGTTTVAAAAGVLDTTWGTSGRANTTVGYYRSYAHASAVQADGKVVAIGEAYDGSTNLVGLVRYNANGSLDTTFGSGGKVTVQVGESHSYMNAVAVQPDGKFVVAGQSVFSGTYRFVVARFTAAGALDSSFGTGGVVKVLSGEEAYGVVLQPDGKIVAAGTTTNGAEFLTARFTAAGVLDSTFGSGGLVVTNIGSSRDVAYAVGLQSDGKVVAAGSMYSGSSDDVTLVRYTTTGSLDTTFGSGGVVKTAVSSGNDSASAVAVDAGGKVVVAGQTVVGSNAAFVTVRYTASGALDSTFGTNGVVATAIGSYGARASSVAVQGDGKVVVGGAYSVGAYQDVAVVRYTAAGVLDSTFATAGKFTLDFGYDDNLGSVVLQSDGKILAFGYSVGGTNAFMSFRLK